MSNARSPGLQEIPSEYSPSNYPKVDRLLESGRIDTHRFNSNNHWAISVAEKVIETFPNQKIYTCAAGISPSGVVHFGNFRDVMTSLAVSKALEKLGKKSRLLFSWDNFDRLRKVPNGLPESFAEHVGKPLSAIPSPDGKEESYARHFERPFEESLKDLGISVEFRNQTKEYAAGRYLPKIKIAVAKRLEIADILLSNMSDKAKLEKKIDENVFRNQYYPISVYSEFTGKDATKVLEYDGDSSITYQCLISNKVSTVDLAVKPIAKLVWKVDWPMRWQEEEVNFEPGGADHASPGGSFDSSGELSQIIFGRRSPLFVGYNFIGLQGVDGKMSGSKGGAMSPAELLQVYEPEILMWLYMRKLPHQSFAIAFDSEVYRVYDEFDRSTKEAAEKEGAGQGGAASQSILFSKNNDSEVTEKLSFRQIVGLGQIVQWNVQLLQQIATATGIQQDIENLKSRMTRAKYWLETYQPEAVLQLRTALASDVIGQLSEEALQQLTSLKSFLENNISASVSEIEVAVYAIPKQIDATKQENAKRQREFFALVYQLLLSSDTGPRLSTFLWAADRPHILSLLP